jgi:hypothetical protein
MDIRENPKIKNNRISQMLRNAIDNPTPKNITITRIESNNIRTFTLFT